MYVCVRAEQYDNDMSALPALLIYYTAYKRYTVFLLLLYLITVFYYQLY